MMEIRKAQQLAWQNKIAKGLSRGNLALEFCLLNGEIGEAFTAWRHKDPGLGSELADIIIYTACIAQTTGLDLQEEIESRTGISVKWIMVPENTFSGSDAFDIRFALLYSRAARAFDSWYRKDRKFGTNLAAVALSVLSIARHAGIGMEQEIERKISVNAARTYQQDSTGIPRKTCTS